MVCTNEPALKKGKESRKEQRAKIVQHKENKYKGIAHICGQ